MKSNLTLLFGLLLFSTVHAQVPAYVPTDGLVGWWPFNGNANDESGNGNDGYIIGANLSYDRFGNFQNAYRFDGTGDVIQVSPNGVSPSSALSVSFWFQLENVNSFSHIISKRYSNFDSPFNSYVVSEILPPPNGEQEQYLVSVSTSDGIFQAYSNDAISLDVWTMLTMTYDGVELRYYLNGVLKGSSAASGNLIYTNLPLYLGGNGAGQSMLGVLDDVAIYDRALSESEIQGLFTGQPVTAPVTCTALPSNLQTGLVGYWPFCGNANDESGNGNDGVVNGATLTEDRFGNANAAYGFDGVDDFIMTENLNLNGSFTASCFLNYTNYTSYNGQIGGTIISNFSNPLAPTGWEIGGGAGTANLGIGNGQFGVNSNQNLPLNEWHHFVVVCDATDSTTTLFLDGNSLESSQEYVTVNPSEVYFNDTDLQVVFGARANTPQSIFFNGLIDDIAIYNRALTPEEVQELYTLDACTFTVYDTLTVENVINVYDTLTIENIVDIYDTTYINVEVYDTLTVENIINVYDTLTIENIVEVYDTLTIENVIDVYDTTTVVETEVVYDTLTIENIVDIYDTLTIENVIDVYDTTTFVETITVYDTLTVENVVDVYDTTYVTVTDTLIIDIPSGVGGTILNTLLLYPNPTSDQLTISYGNFAALAGYSLAIFDTGGSTVHEASITQAQETLDITQWSAGVYQVVVYNAGGVPVETRQIVIQ